jgi:preprotein translocase subunit YajC
VTGTDLLFMGLLFAVAYFLILRPQSQERAAHEELLNKLAKDDHVVTSSGMHGKVVEVSDDLVVLEAGKARITFDKQAVARRQGEPRKPA